MPLMARRRDRGIPSASPMDSETIGRLKDADRCLAIPKLRGQLFLIEGRVRTEYAQISSSPDGHPFQDANALLILDLETYYTLWRIIS